MKKRCFLALAVLGITVLALPCFEGVSAADAQGTGSGDLLAALFGEGGLFEDVRPEGTDVDAMVDSAMEQFHAAESEIAGMVDEAASAIEEKVESLDFDLEALKEYAGELADHFIGEGGLDLNLGSMNTSIQIYQRLKEAEEAYIIEHNRDLLDQADVQIVSNNLIYTDLFDQDPIRSMNYMIEHTYRVDENQQLWFVSSSSDVVLFRHANDRESGYPVTEALFSEDGGNYMPSIEAMCEEMGADPDEAAEAIDLAESMLIYDLEQYLNKHPEYTGLEYDGAIRSKEELRAIFYDCLDELESEEETEEDWE